MKRIGIIFKKEFIDTIRDRKALFFMIVFPILIFPLLIYSIYCSIIIGPSYDEFAHYRNGEKLFK